MVTFVGIESTGTKNIALFHDGFEELRADEQSLIERIKNLRGDGADVSEEVEALKALKEASE